MDEYSKNRTLPFAALTLEQAGQFIKDIISSELKAMNVKESKPVEAEILNIGAAVLLLQEYGYPITKGTVYNLVSNKSIPYKKIGNRLVFNRSGIIDWLEKKTEIEASKSEAALLLAENARKKERRPNHGK